MINSGLFGFGIVLGGYHIWGITHIWLLLSLAVFAGLGGNAAIEFGLALLKALVKRYGNGNGYPTINKPVDRPSDRVNDGTN